MIRSRGLSVMAAFFGLGPIGLGLIGGPQSAPAAPKSEFQVFAAASLSGAFTEIARDIEKRHPGLKVRLNLAGSQQLAAQIEQGAAADVFASADDRWMAYAREHRLIDGEPSTFVRNRLVVIVPRTNPARIRRLQDLARGGTKFLIGADAVPVGHYTRTMLANLARDPAFGADYSRRVLANVVSEEENVKAIAAKIQLGEADAGVVYRSDATGLARLVSTLEVPESANVLASYPIAVVAHAPSPELAREFIERVLSPAGQKILERWGFIPVAATK
ncbi:MAG TPA: molybdate ABC transporter substrate-binding protein [Candidatus Udaeobacter sp.]|jgi:molybdate transport system substrate-binding protein|nr:molybdate ABC transporter substrate-binding protein [Candidatus Udaeobacter sp.]